MLFQCSSRSILFFEILILAEILPNLKPPFSPCLTSQNRVIFVRESSQGAYRTSTHVLSNFFVPLPIFLILSLILANFAYWLVGLVRNGSSFAFFVATCFVTLMTASSYVTMWSAIMPNYYAASGINAASFSYFFLFSGFFLTRSEIPKFWMWLHYFNLFKYPLENLIWNEYTPLKNTCFAFTRKLNQTSGSFTQVCAETGENILMDHDVPNVNPWLNFAIMILFTIGFRVGFYLALRSKSRQIRK